MTEQQKKLFAVKTPAVKNKESRKFPGLLYPVSVRIAALDSFFTAKKIANTFRAINAKAIEAGVNTCEEVGIRPDNFVAICLWINFRHENNGLAADDWAHTPRIETATRAVNTRFKTSITAWHYNKLQITMRKSAKGALSTYSYARGKKRPED